MSSAFQPSAESANGISSAVIQQTYPSGEKGIAFSLEQVAARMLKGRLDPRVRSWAIRTLHEAGDPQGTVNRTQALLDGLRKAAIYVNDPINSEYMQAAHETLCLDDKGFCFKGGDCFLDTERVVRKTPGVPNGAENVAMRDLKIGDLIWGWNAWTVVEAVAKKGELSFSGMFLEGRDKPLYLTKDHHVFVMLERGFGFGGDKHKRISVSKLQPGDEFLTSDEIRTLSKFPKLIELQHDVRRAEAFDIQTTDHYVYLPDYDIVTSQCDDLAIALGSATLSVGIPTYVVAQAFNGEDLPSHVLIGVEDPQSKNRYRVDPSTKNDVGYISHYTREWWIDPMSTAPITLTGETKADFVGVGAPGSFQQTTAAVGAVYTATLSQVQAVTKSLSDALISAEAQYNLLEQASLILRPNAPYDAEPTNPIASLADFPVNGTWTAAMSTLAGDTIATGKAILAALNDALNGARTIYLAANTVDVFIEAKEQDSVFYQILVEGTTDSIIGFLNPAGAVLGGVTTLLGRLLTPTQVTTAQQAQANGQPTGLNAAPAIVFAAIVGGVVVSVAAAIAFVKLLDFLRNKEELAAQMRQIEAAAACLQSGTCTQAQYSAMVKVAGDQRIAAINAQTKQNEKDPWTDRLAQIGDIFMWIAIGGVTIAGLMTVGPFIAEAGAEYRARGVARRATLPTPEHLPLHPVPTT